MANYDQRAPLDFRFGQLSGGVTSLDTTLTSAAFASLPSDLSVTKYLPITLADDSTGVFETVWVTGHSAGSSSVTVIRGREGTSAQAWAQGAAWRCAPTIRDGMPVLTRATLPADGHLGMRAVLSDESGRVVQKGSTGWSALTEVPYGMMGHTSGFQTISPIGTGAVVTMGYQELSGGMTFEAATNALVVPLTGLYLICARFYFTGATGLYSGAVTINSTTGPATNQQPGIDVSANKPTADDWNVVAAGHYRLTAGQKLRMWAGGASSTWGTTGYNGAYVQARYINS